MLKAIASASLFCCALSGCATHRLVLAHPNPSGEPMAERSTAYFWGAAQKRTVTCEKSGLDEVLIRQTFGDTLLSIVTLGIVTPIQFKYVCTKIVPTEGNADEDSRSASPSDAPPR